ncbi:T9SS C-terminal target domain-containing protein, partial [Dyadobacter psychrotolerans]
MASNFTRKFTLLLICFTSIISYGQQKGIVKTARNAPFGIVSFSAESKLAGMGDTKHVDGYVERAGKGLQIFPVGNKGSYRPFATDEDGVNGAYFMENPDFATLPLGAPFRVNTKESSIAKVSTREFWDINGNAATKLSLTWNITSNISELTAGNLSQLSIVGWSLSNARWEKIPSIVDEISILGDASSLASGSVTTLQPILPDNYTAYSLAGLIAAIPTPNVSGKLEVASCSEIRGWMWDENYPERVLTIELVEGNTVLTTVNASEYRKDLVDSGVGTGRYGFSIATPSILMDGSSRQISIRLKNSTIILTGSPKSLSCGFGGVLESADCNTVSGWAWDKNYPNGEALTVELVEGNTVYATAIASTYKDYVKTAGYGTGNYGFNIPFPKALKDGNMHQLSARVKGTIYNLSGSSKSVTCKVSQYSGSFNSIDCDVITGWAWDSNYPNSAVVVELVEGSTVYATSTANIYKESLKIGGIGSGNYGFSFGMPASLRDGKPHQLGIRVQGSTVILAGSPKASTCDVHRYLGSFESADCNTVSGWAWDKNYPNGEALTVELVEGNTVYATAIAGTYKD